jgi:hypothetical protein
MPDMQRKKQHEHRYYLQLKDPADVYNMAQITASFFINPDDVFTGIYELMLNSIEHGNLSIGFKDKGELIRKGALFEEMNRRLAMPQYALKSVHIEIIDSADAVTVTITDEGEGFDWKTHIAHNQSDLKPHGRGLWIAQQSGFDAVRFNEKGNSVTCTSYWHYPYERTRH